jgi:hypothetical protein
VTPGYTSTVPQPRISLLAVASFIVALFPFFFVFAIALGHFAKRYLRRAGLRGDLLATLALMLGYLWLGVLGGGAIVFFSASFVHEFAGQ